MNTLPYEPPPILLLFFFNKYSYLSKEMNYLCLDKGTEGKHKCVSLTLLKRQIYWNQPANKNTY